MKTLKCLLLIHLSFLACSVSQAIPLIYTIESVNSWDYANSQKGLDWTATILLDFDAPGHKFVNGSKESLEDFVSGSGYLYDYGYASLEAFQVDGNKLELGDNDFGINSEHFFTEIRGSSKDFTRYNTSRDSFDFSIHDTQSWSQSAGIGSFIEEMHLSFDNQKFFSFGVITNITSVPDTSPAALFLLCLPLFAFYRMKRT